VNTDQSRELPSPISEYYRDMLHTPVMRFEPSRRVGADRLIRHHERHKWQPIGVSRNDARRGVWALRHGRRLQRGSGRPLAPPRETGCGSPRPEQSRAAQNGRCVPGARGRERTASGHPRGGSGRAGIRSAPTGGGRDRACAPHKARPEAQLGGPLGSPHGIRTGGGGHGKRPSSSPCH